MSEMDLIIVLNMVLIVVLIVIMIMVMVMVLIVLTLMAIEKGPHKQSLIVKCLSDFQNIKNIRVLKVRMDILR